MAALDAAAARALTASRRCAGRRSASVRMELSSAPATKPSCTLVVSQDCKAPESFHSTVSCGTTAEAENQTDMPSSAARASSETFRHLPRSSGRRRAAAVMRGLSVPSFGGALGAGPGKRRRVAAAVLGRKQMLEVRIAVESWGAVQEQAAGVRRGAVGRIEAPAQQAQISGELAPVVSRVGDPPRHHPGPAALDVEKAGASLEPVVRHPAQPFETFAGSLGVFVEEGEAGLLGGQRAFAAIDRQHALHPNVLADTFMDPVLVRRPRPS